MKHKVFVYGTLKRRGSNHRLLEGQVFQATAQTQPVYRMYALDGFPAMVDAPQNGLPIDGEIWEVDEEALVELDKLEGVDEGLYKRVTIPLLPPNDRLKVEGYIYLLSVAGRRDCGTSWPV
ncbi:MAG: gamma-glutamylcyclotransferase family protein [Nibricoccus sp.]